MYSRFRGIQYELDYSARDRHTGLEVMYFCDGLEIPDAAGGFAPLRSISPAYNRDLARQVVREPGSARRQDARRR